MRYRTKFSPLYLLILFFFAGTSFGQTVKQQKMALLEFMVGEWIGTTTVYKEGQVAKQGSAYQSIQYDLDSNILVIELNTELLQLHTVIYFDDKDNTYYYYPFSSRGVNKYPAKYDNGQFIVSSSATNRFIFTTTEDGGFREYGERLIDGKWVKYFEDMFQNSQ